MSDIHQKPSGTVSSFPIFTFPYFHVTVEKSFLELLPQSTLGRGNKLMHYCNSVKMNQLEVRLNPLIYRNFAFFRQSAGLQKKVKQCPS